jgi:galactokinase
VSGYSDVFGGAPDVHASAPGRVNLIGEHTDYNDGFVLPIALPLRTRVDLGRRNDGDVHAFSESLPAAQARATFTRGREARTGGWIDYVQGITQALDRRGLRVPGFNLHVVSDVPAGAGLASSAALEVSVARALRERCALDLDDVELARVAHEAETRLVGAPVGTMDQMAASLADDRNALFIDTRTLKYERLPLPSSVELAIIDSGITHQHASGDYRQRRRECERVADIAGVRSLRDLTLEGLSRLTLPPPLDRRARHVVTENARVLEAVDALRHGDAARLGKLFVASHVSMRDDYEVSLPEIDAIVGFSLTTEDGVHGARLTGGGFGGAVIILCRAGEARRVAQSVWGRYHPTSGGKGRILLPT